MGYNKRKKKKKSLFYRTSIILLIVLFSIIIGVCLAGFSFRYLSKTHMPVLFNDGVGDVGKVILKQNVVDALNRLYYENPFNEFAVCLDGFVNVEGDLEVVSFAIMPPKFSNATRFVFQDYDIWFCDSTAGILHSHPDSDGHTACYFSAQDYYLFGSSQKQFFGLQCGIDKFVFIKSNKISDHMTIRVE